MHEAQSRLSALVKAVEEEGEIEILCRNGMEIAEIFPRRASTGKAVCQLVADPALRVTFAPGHDPTEPASEEEWPEEYR